jgi:hypothetical protein
MLSCDEGSTHEPQLVFGESSFGAARTKVLAELLELLPRIEICRADAGNPQSDQGEMSLC